MPSKIVAPHHREPFIDKDGIPNSVSQAWIDSLTDEFTGILDRVDELEPQFRTVTAADSPVTAANNDYILSDTSAGPVTIILPASGRLSVSQSKGGTSNKTTLQGTIEGETDPEIIGDDDSWSLAYIGTEYRYV